MNMKEIHRNEKRQAVIQSRREELKKRAVSRKEDRMTGVHRPLFDPVFEHIHERGGRNHSDSEYEEEEDEGDERGEEREQKITKDEPGIYLVLSKDFFDQTVVHGAAVDQSSAKSVYDLISGKIADHNEACKNNGKKRDVVEMLYIPMQSNTDFRCDIGYTVGTGYDHERVRCLFNNVRDEDNSIGTLTDVKSRSIFYRPVKISDKMCRFLDRPTRTTMTRHEVSRLLSEYIKKKKLVDPADKRYIYPDARLHSLISDVPPRLESTYGDPRVTIFDLHRRLIAHHFFGP